MSLRLPTFEGKGHASSTGLCDRRPGFIYSSTDGRTQPTLTEARHLFSDDDDDDDDDDGDDEGSECDEDDDNDDDKLIIIKYF